MPLPMCVRPGLVTLHDHWASADADGHATWAFHLTFEGADDLHRRAAEVQALTPWPSLDPVATAGLHLTIEGFAPINALDDAVLDDIRDEVFDHAADLADAVVRFDEIFVYEQGYALAAPRTEWLYGVKDACHAAVRRGWGRVAPPQLWGFHPHATMAYANRDVAVDEVTAALSSLSDEVVEVREPRLSLIAVERRRHTWTWRVRDQIVLGQ